MVSRIKIGVTGSLGGVATDGSDGRSLTSYNTNWHVDAPQHKNEVRVIMRGVATLHDEDSTGGTVDGHRMEPLA